MDQYYLGYIEDKEKRLVLDLEGLIMQKSMEFYQQKGVKWLSAPVTTGSVSSPMGLGSDSKPVKISLDGQNVYLADSMQFLLEYGCRFYEKGCWYIMPTFRGEDVDERHLKQFFHSEAEIPGDLEKAMGLAEEYVKYLVAAAAELLGCPKRLDNLLSQEIPRVTFNEAEKIVGGKGIEYQNGWRSLTNRGEKLLLEHFNSPVWVTHYDEAAVPFYQYAENGKANNADLLMGIGETVGCGERWASGEEVVAALKRHQVNPAEYQWYINMKEKYPLKTSGFGMGIERFLLYLLNKTDIRDVQVFRRFNDGKDVV